MGKLNTQNSPRTMARDRGHYPRKYVAKLQIASYEIVAPSKLERQSDNKMSRKKLVRNRKAYKEIC